MNVVRYVPIRFLIFRFTNIIVFTNTIMLIRPYITNRTLNTKKFILIPKLNRAGRDWTMAS